MNKLKILSLLPALVLCSCGAKKSKYAGTYQFRLGKSDGNHMEVTAVLTDENDSKVEGYKVMSLSADLGAQLDPMKELDEIEDMLDDVLPIISQFVEEELIEKLPQLVQAIRTELTEIKQINFFYKVTEYKNAKYGNRIELGTHALADIFNNIKTKHPELADLVNEGIVLAKTTGLFRDDMYIMPETSKYAFNAFIGKKGLTFQVPVAKDDLNYQLIWYGFEKTFGMNTGLPENYMERMPGVKGEERFGTHPARETKNNVVIKDEVAQVNKEFAYEFSKSPLYASDDIMDSSETARFVLETESDTNKLLMKFPEAFTPGEFSGYIGLTDRKAITLDVAADGLCSVTPNGKTGLKEGFFDKNGVEFRYDEVISEPFSFRDFNVVNVGLAKVEA